jgi:hypothetical protein
MNRLVPTTVTGLVHPMTPGLSTIVTRKTSSAPERARRRRKFMQKPRVPDKFQHQRQASATSPTPHLLNAENGVGCGAASQARARTLRRARLLSPAGGMRAGVLMAFWIVAEMSAH